MTTDDIVRKIQNLLDLSGNNSNEHEAALAASKAQELMLKYDLSAEAVAGRTTEKAPIGKANAYTFIKVPAWKSGLFKTVADTSNCGCYVSHSTLGYKSNGTRQTAATLVLVGRENDVQVAKYVFEYLVRELDRLAEAYTRTVRTYGQRGLLKHKRESWYIGAANAVCETLRTQYLARTKGAEANALVVVKDNAVKEYLDSEVGHLRKTYRAKRDVDGEAYWKGHATGKTIGVNPGVGGGGQRSRPHQIGG